MNKAHGMTLVEMLVAMSILSVLMLAFTQVFGGSLRASTEINARNELISEGQIAQQLIASRLQGAYFVYPTGQTIQLTGSGDTTPNTVRSGAGQDWIVGTDPFIALILPPKTTGQCPTSSTTTTGTENACFTFYAYYPIVRGTFIGTNRDSAPPADPSNADVWFLMEYRANLYDGINRSTNLLLTPPNTATVLTNSASTHPTVRGRAGTILTDYVQPTTTAPTYTMFQVNTSAGTWAELKLRMLQNRGGKALSAPTGTAPLSTRVYPRNTQ